MLDDPIVTYTVTFLTTFPTVELLEMVRLEPPVFVTVYKHVPVLKSRLSLPVYDVVSWIFCNASSAQAVASCRA